MKNILPVLAVFALTGCGLSGGTSRFKLELPVTTPAGPIEVTQVELEPHAAKLTNIGSYAWGKYDDDDLSNLKESLHRTLTGASGEGPANSRVHAVVRSYLVATSNTTGGVLACVAWAYFDQKLGLIFHEQFYATGSAYMNKTLGGLKDEVHEAIVRRIAETAVQLSLGKFDNFQPARAEHTYDIFAEAEATVPKELSVQTLSWGLGFGYYWNLSSGSASYSSGERDQIIDWTQRSALTPR